MNRRTQKLIVSAIAFVCFAAYQYFTTGQMPNFGGNSGKQSTQSQPNTTNYSNDDEILDALQDKKLIYTKHAKCRMDCRTISKSEVLAILEDGKINHRKSEKTGSQCPTYAVEGFTKDKQEVRIIFADCDDVTKVVTTIDLGRKYDCYCE